MTLGRLARLAVTSIFVCGICMSEARADDLSSISGNWATSAENCAKWIGPGFESMAEQSGKIMNVKGDAMNWSRGSCTASDVAVRGTVISGKASCEYRTKVAAGSFSIKVVSANNIVVQNVLSGNFSRGLSTSFVRCDCAPRSKDDYLGCQK